MSLGLCSIRSINLLEVDGVAAVAGDPAEIDAVPGGAAHLASAQVNALAWRLTGCRLLCWRKYPHPNSKATS
jgi:hypothetical protein